METCFVSSTRRDTTTRPLVSSPRPYGATLDLLLETAGEAVVVHVQTAKLTYPVLSAFFEEVRGILEEGSRHLVLDLSAVSYIDSSGLAVLIEGMQNVEAYGGKFVLAGLQEKVRPIFEMARLDQVFIIFPHVDAALAGD